MRKTFIRAAESDASNGLILAVSHPPGSQSFHKLNIGSSGYWHLNTSTVGSKADIRNVLQPVKFWQGQTPRNHHHWAQDLLLKHMNQTKSICRSNLN
jgi:hypothetical protein